MAKPCTSRHAPLTDHFETHARPAPLHPPPQDLPKLLDICALFVDSSSDLTAKLVAAAFRLLPKLGAELTSASSALSKNMEAMRGKAAPHMSVRGGCAAAGRPPADAPRRPLQIGTLASAPHVSPLLGPLPQASRSGSASPEDIAVLRDAARYFLDVAATLAALLRAHPSGAPLLLAGEGAELLPALSAAHDQVAPAVARSLGARATAATSVQSAAVPHGALCRCVQC